MTERTLAVRCIDPDDWAIGKSRFDIGPECSGTVVDQLGMLALARFHCIPCREGDGRLQVCRRGPYCRSRIPEAGTTLPVMVPAAPLLLRHLHDSGRIPARCPTPSRRDRPSDGRTPGRHSLEQRYAEPCPMLVHSGQGRCRLPVPGRVSGSGALPVRGLLPVVHPDRTPRDPEGYSVSSGSASGVVWIRVRTPLARVRMRSTASATSRGSASRVKSRWKRRVSPGLSTGTRS